MRIYYFPFWRKQYFFHASSIFDEQLLSIYHPYGKILKLVWWCWNSSRYLRNLSSLSINRLPFKVNELGSQITGTKDFVWSANYNVDGQIKKTTFLFKETGDLKQSYFVKYAIEDDARGLIKHEAKVLKQLQSKTFAPQLRCFTESSMYTFLSTDFFSGVKRTEPTMSDSILRLMIEIGKSAQQDSSKESELLFLFAHGDFCPWNILESTKEIKVIDWEMAGIYPLGYDLFTYIFQTSFLLHPRRKPLVVYEENVHWMNKFFCEYNIIDWQPYLSEFASLKFQQYKNDPKLKFHFQNLISLCTDL